MVMIVYGLLLCPYAVYKNWKIRRSVKENVKYNEYVYYNVSWILKSLYLAALPVTICAIYIIYILKSEAEEVRKAFAALKQIKISLNQKGKKYDLVLKLAIYLLIYISWPIFFFQVGSFTTFYH